MSERRSGQEAIISCGLPQKNELRQFLSASISGTWISEQTPAKHYYDEDSIDGAGERFDWSDQTELDKVRKPASPNFTARMSSFMSPAVAVHAYLLYPAHARTPRSPPSAWLSR